MNFKGMHISPLIRSCQVHEHRQWELIYQTENPTTAVVSGANYRVEVGELIIIPPNTPHRTVGDAPFRDISMQIETLDFSTSPMVVKDVEGRILTLLDMMLSLRDGRSAEDEILLERLSEAVLLCAKKAAAVAHEPPFVTHFKKILLTHLEDAFFDLGAAIEGLGYHPDYFRRCFKRHTSQSPLAYLNTMRIERAKDLLRLEPSLSIGQVASRCGFRDPLYFSTAFRQSVGLSPLSYRKRYE